MKNRNEIMELLEKLSIWVNEELVNEIIWELKITNTYENEEEENYNTGGLEGKAHDFGERLSFALIEPLEFGFPEVLAFNGNEEIDFVKQQIDQFMSDLVKDLLKEAKLKMEGKL